VTARTDTVLVRATFPNAGDLDDGQLVRVNLEARRPKKGHPSEAALIANQEGVYVFVSMMQSRVRASKTGAESGAGRRGRKRPIGRRAVIVQGLQAFRPGVASRQTLCRKTLVGD